MGATRTLVLGSLRRRPGRALFCILGVALGIAVVVAIFTVDHVTMRVATTDRDPSWRADLEVRPAGDLADPAAELARIPGVLAHTAVVQAAAEVSVRSDAALEGAAPFTVGVLALEASALPAMGIAELELGEPLLPRLPDATGPGGVLVGRAVAERLGVGPGDTLFLARPRRAARKDCVEGALVEGAPEGRPGPARPFVVRGVLAFESVGRQSGGAVCVIDYGDGLALLEGQFLSPKYWVARDAGVDVERMSENLGRSFSYDLRRGAVVGQQADERAFRNGVRLAGLMSLALGLFVIFHTLSMSLVERVREVGILAALGFSRARIATVFFCEALFLSLSAGALGLGGGLLLARLMLRLGISSLGLTSRVKEAFFVPWPEVSVLTALGVGIALVGSVFPLLRAREADTVRALRGEDLELGAGVGRGFHLFAAVLLLGILPAVFFTLVPLLGEGGRDLLGVVFLGIGVMALLVGTPLVVPGLMAGVADRLGAPLARLSPFSGLMAARSIAQSPTRIAASVAAIALVTAAFVGLRGLTGSLQGETSRWADEAVADKVFLGRLNGADWRPLAAALHGVDGVLGVEPAGARIEAPFRIVGLPVDELAGYGPLAEDPELARTFAAERQLIVTRRLATQRGLAVGDSVPISTPSSGVQRFTVVAVSDAYGYFDDPHERAYGVVAEGHLERLFCLDGARVDRVGVRLVPGTSPDVVFPAAVAQLGREPEVMTGIGIRQFELYDVQRDFRVFDVIILMTLCIAGVGVLNGQLLAAMERAKELGVLRALGAAASQMRRAVLIESLIVGTAGGLVGLALGLAIVPVLVRSLRLLSGLDLPTPGLSLSYLQAPVGAVVVTVLAGLYPTWRMNRMDPVRAVRSG